MRALLLGGLGVACLLAVMGVYLMQRPAVGARQELDLQAVLADDAEGFARATGPRPFRFPEDHGPHPRFRNEWWYFTGNLVDPGGRRFGYQLTFFRTAVAPEPVRGASAWRSEQLYMGHFAVTDVASERFHAFERLSRGGLGLAGARAAPLHVFIESWSATSTGVDTWPLRLRAAEADVSIDLEVSPGKPLVAQGEQGWSPKTADGSSASYYYSATRLVTRGTLASGGRHFDVEGSSWLDREWSSGGLGPTQVGWDWFALQLSDGSELMWYQLRERDGGRAHALGTWVEPDGRAHALGGEQVHVEVTGDWRSPRDGITYPAEWDVRLAARDVELRITPWLQDQELELLVRYWEGAVRVEGRVGQQAVEGVGYVELTGYGGAPPIH